MSELDNLIPPEIINDELFDTIVELASREDVYNILEIGASSGEGSTKAFLEGMGNRSGVRLFCFEVSIPRFKKLFKKYIDVDKRIKFFNGSIVFPKEFPGKQLVIDFYNNVSSPLNKYSLDTVLGWLDQDLAYMKEHRIPCLTVHHIKKVFKIDEFDLVLIDGSEFTGLVEFEKIRGAKIIVLDDVCSFKNHYSRLALSVDKSYKLIKENLKLRLGYSVFEKI